MGLEKSHSLIYNKQMASEGWILFDLQRFYVSRHFEHVFGDERVINLKQKKILFVRFKHGFMQKRRKCKGKYSKHLRF